MSTFTVYIYAHAGDNTSAVSEKFLQQRLDSEARKAPDQQERGSMDAQLSKYRYRQDPGATINPPNKKGNHIPFWFPAYISSLDPNLPPAAVLQDPSMKRSQEERWIVMLPCGSTRENFEY